jgi:hypothetical protein
MPWPRILIPLSYQPGTQKNKVKPTQLHLVPERLPLFSDLISVNVAPETAERAAVMAMVAPAAMIPARATVIATMIATMTAVGAAILNGCRPVRGGIREGGKGSGQGDTGEQGQ